jgi:hypothetical protein
MLGLTIVLSLVTIAVMLDRISLFDSLAAGDRVSIADAQASDDHIHAVAIASIVLLILTAIAWLGWQSLAYRNALDLGIRNPRFSTGWAIGWWFVPVATLVKPKQVMNDIWRGSDPGLVGNESGFSERPVDMLLHLWWAAWLASTFLERLAVHLDDTANTFFEVHSAGKTYIVAEVVTIVAASYAIIIITRITRRLEERRRIHAAWAPVQQSPAAFGGNAPAAATSSVGPPV